LTIDIEDRAVIYFEPSPDEERYNRLFTMYLRSLPEFQYLAPKSVQEAGSLLQEYIGKAKVMAGGTDLLVNMKHRTVAPKYVIGLKNVPDLDGITYSEAGGLRLGTLVNHQSIAVSPIIRDRFGALATACSKIGTPQIRSMGTIGGNLCNAAPSADSAPPLIALGSVLKLVSPERERIIPLEEFLTAPGETILIDGEILVEIQVPNLPSHTGLVYFKLPARTAVDIAAVGVAALIALDSEDETCTDAKIVLGAVAPTPIRAKRGEEIIRGKQIEDNLIQKVAELASEEAQPISDVRSSAHYRVEMVKVLTKQAINLALKQAKST
jgi:carbon-monoxide dehydrogenase medium subunit